MNFEYNITPKENLPTVSRRAIVSNIQIDTVNKRIHISIQTMLLDIHNEPFGSPEYIGTVNLIVGPHNPQEISEELEAMLEFEASVVTNLTASGLDTAIRNIFEVNNIEIV